MLLVIGGSAMAQDAAVVPSPRMAMGLIVKLKDAKPPSVVRLKASAVPSDGPPRQRQRMADAARRKRVSFLVSRQTAFGATVIHPGHVISIEEAQAQAERLRADPDVEWVVVNEIVKKQAITSAYVPVDPLPQASTQTWLGSVTSTGLPGIANIEAAWTKLTDGRALTPVVVAVLDTGILPDPSLQGRYMPGYDFVYKAVLANDGDGIDPDPTDMGDGITALDIANHPDVFNGQATGCPNQVAINSWHGLEVSGLLGANVDGHAGMLAPLRGASNAQVILPVRVAGKCGAEIASIIEGMLWSANVPYQGSPTANAHPAARVINLSFGGGGVCSLANPTRDAGWLYANTIATLKSQGVLVVASAGNGDDTIGEGAPTLPANCTGVLAVTGLDMRGYKTGYANLIAHGVAVASGDLKPDRHFADAGIVITSYDDVNTTYYMRTVAGTSFAAPQAAGVAAMMLAVNPALTVDQLIQGIETSARAHVTSADLASVDWTGVPTQSRPQSNCSSANLSQCYCTTATCGAGILDAAQAVDWAVAQVGGFTGPASSYASPNSYFVAPRPAAVAPAGGGGGGSLGWIELFGLASLTAMAAAFKRRQSV